MKRLEGKTAVVTGGASGIGKEIVDLFTAEGAKVHSIDISEGVDITKEEQVKAAFVKIGSFDVLVNCAGIFSPGTITETTYADWTKILDVNLNGAFLCSKYAAESMLKTGGGSIINVASEAGISAIPGQVSYNVSKAAMIHMSNCMAVDYATKNIRVNCVSPGRVLTPLVQSIIDNSPNPEATKRELSEDRPVMHMGKPEDIARACLHFADDSMMYATGAVLAVDGGYTVR